jgi:hypothetical protein
MTTWQESEFVVPVDEKVGGQALLPLKDARRAPSRVPLLRQQQMQCTGWEEIVFEMADDDALD